MSLIYRFLLKSSSYLSQRWTRISSAITFDMCIWLDGQFTATNKQRFHIVYSLLYNPSNNNEPWIPIEIILDLFIYIVTVWTSQLKVIPNMCVYWDNDVHFYMIICVHTSIPFHDFDNFFFDYFFFR